MSQPFLDHLQMDTCFQQHAGVEVTQVVKPETAHHSSDYQFFKISGQCCWVKGLPYRTGEYQTVVFISTSKLRHNENLSPMMGSQHLNGIFIQSNGPTTLGRLRRDEPETCPTNALQALDYGYRSMLKVNVPPF